MMHIYATSDTHIGHRGILKYRPWYKNLTDMRDQIVSTWNAVVTPQDTVYHLGDFAWTRDETVSVLKELNGHIHLIRGNHDDHIKDGMGFVSIRDTRYLRAHGKRVFLSHYPHGSWRNSNHGSYHLYGHTHGHMPGLGRSCDVGWDVWRRPVNVTEFMEMLENNPRIMHHSTKTKMITARFTL